MKRSMLFRNWWVILIQGILMIALSIVIFNNPETALAVAALYMGIIVIISGLVGVIAYFTNASKERDLFTLIGSVAILVIGILMVTNTLITIKAITVLFGLLVAIVGLVLLTGSFVGRKQWSLWWVIALMGVGALVTGIKSIMDIYAGVENVSILIGIAVLISGIGLVFLALLKKKLAMAIKNRY